MKVEFAAALLLAGLAAAGAGRAQDAHRMLAAVQLSVDPHADPDAGDKAYPPAAWKAGIDGAARLTCRVTILHRLEACEVLSETPAGAGFGAAAILTAQTLRTARTDAAGAPVEGGWLTVPLTFRAPLPPPPPGQAHMVTRPIWTSRPNADDLKQAYPPAASRVAGGRGGAAIKCLIDGMGSLTGCRVAQETPVGAGFGQAALKLSKLFHMKPVDAAGQAVVGGTIFLPIVLQPAARP